jgi:hypothetical protein
LQYITSNGQYAIATGVDTVWTAGDVTDQAITTFRLMNPTEVMMSGHVIVEAGSIQPAGATLEITAPLLGLKNQGKEYSHKNDGEANN